MAKVTMTVNETRDGLGRRLDAAHFHGDITIITKYGEPRGALVPYNWYLRYTQGNGPSGTTGSTP